ncbi:MAG: hypothetical protein WA952_10010 [Lewinella sp.]
MNTSFQQTLPALWTQSWALLNRAANTGDGSFATPSVTSVASLRVARPRIVVLRGADDGLHQLTCYTDRRSVKVDHLNRGSEFSWLAWDPEAKIQFIGGGPTTWASEETHREIFSELPKHSRKAYATITAPGTPLPNAGTGLPDDWEEMDEKDTDYVLSNFGVLTTQLRWAEVLKLDRSGNTRLAAARQDDGQWSFTYIVP